MTNVEPLYKINIRCLNCKNPYQSSRVRPSFKKSSGTDSDFCVNYKEYNPDYYVVRVCPNCGFAFTENFSDKWTPHQIQEIKSRVTDHWNKRDYGGERTWEEALETYKLALLCAQIKGEKERIVAGLLHHIAWLYRYKGMTELELKFLQFALDAYIVVFETEGMELNNARLMYLMGELNRRLCNYNEAVKWFSRVVNDKRIMDSAMIHHSREQWAITRQDMLTASLDTSSELAENK